MKNLVKMGDYVKIQTGKLDANTAVENGKYPFFTCAIEPLRIDHYKYDCECVLVAGNGDLNVKYYNGKFEAYQRTYIIESKNHDLLVVPYLYRFLDNYIDVLRKQAIGGVIKYIKLGNLTDAMIPVPTIDKQQAIVERLAMLDMIIANKNKQLKKMDELVKSRFIELFGDMYLNPLEWTEVSLESISDIVSGITKGRKIKTAELREVPYMAVSNVKNGYIDWTTVKTIEVTEQELNQYRLLPDDVLMTEGGDSDKVGRGAIIREPLENCIHQNHIFRVRLNERDILPVFFAEYLQHQRAKRYFLGCAKQTTGIASINMKQLRNLPVLMPPLELQQQFATFVTQTDKSKYYNFTSYKYCVLAANLIRQEWMLCQTLSF